jgi:hypothetical protein
VNFGKEGSTSHDIVCNAFTCPLHKPIKQDSMSPFVMEGMIIEIT